jgi:acyl-CoA dehydrogenase
MRGTCSAGFNLAATLEPGQVFPVPYHVIHGRTMMPVAHLTWSSVWAGIAAGALERSRRFVRMAAARSNGHLPPGAAQLAQGTMTLRSLRHSILGTLATYQAALAQGDAIDTISVQSELNLLKVNSSELATATVLSALRATGLTGYRNDSEFSVGRYLRDVLSSSIMINNDRILANTAAGLMLSEIPGELFSV